MNISFWKHHPVADQQGHLLAKQTIAFQHLHQFDYIKLTPAGSWLAVCYGLEDAWNGDSLGRREILRPFIRQPQDWYVLPDIRSNIPRMLDEQLLAARLTGAAFAGEPVYATVFSPVSQAIQLAGLAQFLEHWRQFPEALSHGLAVLTQNLNIILAEFQRESIRHLYYVIQHARPDGLPPSVHQQVSQFTDEICLADAATRFEDVLVHLHGQDVFNPLASYPATVRFHLTAVSAANNLGSATCVPGLPADWLVNCQTPETARQLLHRYYPFSSVGSSAHLMADCVLPLAFPDQQIALWKQIARML